MCSALSWLYLIGIAAGSYLWYFRKYHNYEITVPPSVLIRSRKAGAKTGGAYPLPSRGWFRLLDQRDLPLPGSKKHVAAFGREFIVVRNDLPPHDVAVMDAYCPHLGNNLGLSGCVVKNNTVVCSFHGWAYRTDNGECNRNALAQLKVWPSLECNGLILVDMTGLFEEDSTVWQPKEIPEIKSRRWQYRGRTSQIIHALHAQDLPENGADIQHFKWVHRHTVPCLPHDWQPQWSRVKPKTDDALVNYYFQPPYTSMLTFQQRTFLTAAEQALKCLTGRKPTIQLPFKFNLTGFQIGPGLVYLFFDSTFGKGVLIQSMTPITKSKQEIIHRLYMEWKTPYWWSVAILKGEALQVAKDAEIWSNKIHIPHPIVASPQDRTLIEWRAWYYQFYAASTGTSVEQKTYNCNW